MFREQIIWMHDIVPFHYSSPHQDLFNDLSSDPNKDRMQMLRTWEVDVPTHHFKVHQTISV